MKKNLLSLLTLTIFLSGCSLNNQRTLESDMPTSKSSKAKMEVGAEILSLVPDDQLVHYYKALMDYQLLLKQSNADQTVLQKAKETVYTTLKTALSMTQSQKIPYDKAKGAMLLSRISASVKDPQNEDEFFNKIFQLPNHEAAAIIRFILDAVQKGLLS